MSIPVYAYIRFRGDTDVGIFSATWEILDVGNLDSYPEQREDFREKLVEAFAILVGEQVDVVFSDEIAE